MRNVMFCGFLFFFSLFSHGSEAEKILLKVENKRDWLFQRYQRVTISTESGKTLATIKSDSKRNKIAYRFERRPFQDIKDKQEFLRTSYFKYFGDISLLKGFFGPAEKPMIELLTILDDTFYGLLVSQQVGEDTNDSEAQGGRGTFGGGFGGYILTEMPKSYVLIKFHEDAAILLKKYDVIPPSVPFPSMYALQEIMYEYIYADFRSIVENEGKCQSTL